MSLSKFAALMVLASVLCTVASPVAEAANGAKRKSVIASRGHRFTGFVPPPPAYMPSILPEYYARNGVQNIAVAEKKVENPLTKYVQTRVGDEVKAMSTRKGVSTWAPLRVKKSS